MPIQIIPAFPTLAGIKTSPHTEEKPAGCTTPGFFAFLRLLDSLLPEGKSVITGRNQFLPGDVNRV